MNLNTKTNFKKCPNSTHFTVITQSWDSKQTEHCHQVADIPISYSGVLQLLPGLEITYPEGFSEFPQSLQVNVVLIH
jgi:hypothetical protein